jgi:hypothetical protein
VNAIVVKPKSVFASYFSSVRATFGRGSKNALVEQVLAVAAAEGVGKREASDHFEGRWIVGSGWMGGRMNGVACDLAASPSSTSPTKNLPLSSLLPSPLPSSSANAGAP